MRLNRVFVLLLTLAFSLVLVSCGGSTNYYYASETADENSDWVYYVVVEKQGDKITDAHWSAYHILGNLVDFDGLDKYEASKAGKYVMARGLKWHEQADLVVNKLLESQDYNDRVPIPTGATIDTSPFYTLVEKALASDPVKKGNYKDGHHVIESKDKETRASAKAWDADKEEVIETGEFEYFNYGVFVVVNGTVVDAYFDAAFAGFRYELEENNKIVTAVTDEGTFRVAANTTVYKSKNQLGYSYAMKKPNGPGNFEFHEAAKSFGEYFVLNQNEDLPTLNNDGVTDAISGVTITITAFYEIIDLIPNK